MFECVLECVFEHICAHSHRGKLCHTTLPLPNKSAKQKVDHHCKYAGVKHSIVMRSSPKRARLHRILKSPISKPFISHYTIQASSTRSWCGHCQSVQDCTQKTKKSPQPNHLHVHYTPGVKHLIVVRSSPRRAKSPLGTTQTTWQRRCCSIF